MAICNSYVKLPEGNRLQQFGEFTFDMNHIRTGGNPVPLVNIQSVNGWSSHKYFSVFIGIYRYGSMSVSRKGFQLLINDSLVILRRTQAACWRGLCQTRYEDTSMHKERGRDKNSSRDLSYYSYDSYQNTLTHMYIYIYIHTCIYIINYTSLSLSLLIMF